MNVVASETIYQIINLVFGPPGDMSAQTLMKQSERHDFCNFRGGGLFNHFLESEKVTYGAVTVITANEPPTLLNI